MASTTKAHNHIISLHSLPTFSAPKKSSLLHKHFFPRITLTLLITFSNNYNVDFFIIRMASFWFLLQLALILPFMSSSSQLKSDTSSIIPASPALLATPPPQSLSPYQELSPDITPLLPSPGSVLPSPTESSMPTIPSNPSPPNPDDFLAAGPESAFSPFGSLPAFSMASRIPVGSLLFVSATAATTYWSINHLRI